MARYDYFCKSCNEIEEIEKPIADFEREELCGTCGSSMNRLPPADTGFILKGKGWYKTDYPKGSN